MAHVPLFPCENESMDGGEVWYCGADLQCVQAQEFRSREECRNLISEKEIYWHFLTGNCFEWMLVHARSSLSGAFCCFARHTFSFT